MRFSQHKTLTLTTELQVHFDAWNASNLHQTGVEPATKGCLLWISPFSVNNKTAPSRCKIKVSKVLLYDFSICGGEGK